MKKALILLNMGGARNKEELKEFLYNMFRDKRIIHSPIRYILSPLISNLRHKKVWKEYEKIGGSKIYHHTEKLVEKLQDKLGDEYSVLYSMRYTKPFLSSVLKDGDFDEVYLFPMYPHFSITTTRSSFDEVEELISSFRIKPDTFMLDSYYSKEDFNQTIIKNIKEKYKPDTNLIFSAHGLPVKISNKDVYKTQVEDHVVILEKLLNKNNLEFKSINLAYQSKVGPMKWLEPSLESVLQKMKNQNVLIYPISFTIDNSETDLELKLEYAHKAKDFGVSNYDVCNVQNSDDEFIEAICKMLSFMKPF